MSKLKKVERAGSLVREQSVSVIIQLLAQASIAWRWPVAVQVHREGLGIIT